MVFFRNRHGQCLVRAISTALLVGLVLLLTPCCEVFAALPNAGTSASADAHHNYHDDGNTRPAGGHCASWLNQIFVPASDAALPASAPTGIDAAPPYQRPSLQAPHPAGVVLPGGAPPPGRAVYLLTSRFLL